MIGALISFKIPAAQAQPTTLRQVIGFLVVIVVINVVYFCKEWIGSVKRKKREGVDYDYKGDSYDIWFGKYEDLIDERGGDE
jgi:hypothetical protein